VCVCIFLSRTGRLESRRASSMLHVCVLLSHHMLHTTWCYHTIYRLVMWCARDESTGCRVPTARRMILSTTHMHTRQHTHAHVYGITVHGLGGIEMLLWGNKIQCVMCDV